MEVKITFDTEKESVEDLKKLIAHLQKIIDEKESSSSAEHSFQHIQQPEQPQNRKKTTGGCEIIPFQDMDDTMEKIFSGKK